MMKMGRGLLVLGALACLSSIALAQNWSDTFEDYDVGEICGQGGWEEWSGSVDVCGSVTEEQANSGTKSLKIVGVGPDPLGDDTVQQFQIEGGVWTFKIMTYLANDATGIGWVIMLNRYAPDPFNWSYQVQFNADLDIVRDSLAGPSIPLIRNDWVEFRAEINIVDDLVDFYYNDVRFVEGKSWVDGETGNGDPWIRCLDLYGDEPGRDGVSAIYFDDPSLTAVGGERGCMYKIKKDSKAKKNCPKEACPKKADIYASGEECSELKDCDKKIKIKKLDCPEGEKGFCKRVKGKRVECKK